MTTIMRCFGLFLLLASTGCLSAGGGPLDQGGQGAFTVMGSPAGQREGTPFSPRIIKQLEARGIKVHQDAEPEPERTTVEQAWEVEGSPMIQVDKDNPTTVLQEVAVLLRAQWPNIVKNGKIPEINHDAPGKDHFSNCSGTLIDEKAILTAAHCYYSWEDIGNEVGTQEPFFAKVRRYSVAAYPRRTGDYRPYGPFFAKKAFWDFDNWIAGNDHKDYDRQLDYAVLRFKTAIPGEHSGWRQASTPEGMRIEAAHYPSPSDRHYEMYYSFNGYIDKMLPGTDHLYSHSLSTENGTSGAGLFETAADNSVVPGIVGIAISEIKGGDGGKGRYREGSPNTANMLTLGMVSGISDWVFQPY